MPELSASLALLGSFGVAGLGTALLVALLRRWALRLDLLDHPNHRSSHKVPTPRVGGIGMAVVLLGGLALLACHPVGRPHATPLLTLSGLGLAIAAISAYDDIRSVAPHYRLIAHAVVAVFVIALVGSVQVIDVGALGRIPVGPPLAQVLTFVWVVALINAINFIDGIDGMAGAQAAVSGASWVLLGLASGALDLGIAGALMAGAAVGFLFHNWSPARIFMGDGGSALLGFLLATVPWVLGGSVLWLVTAFVLWPALLDTGWTLARRVVTRMPIWQSHRMHMYQRLVAAGQAPSRVSAAYAAASLAGLLVAGLTLRGRHSAPLVAMVSATVFVAWALSALRWPRPT